MGKGKLAKFAEMAENPLVVECPFWQLQQEGFPLKGKWHEEFFKNGNPIVLELGCGRGEYTIGLARRFPEKNFIGIDIKGARMWHGAKTALEEGMKNVAFLRTNIECIAGFFAPDEVAELWLTFSDPQMKKATKRLTSTYFMERYRKFLVDGGLINVKTDSNFLATYTKYMVEKNGLPMEQCTFDLYGQQATDNGQQTLDSSLTEIRTYYESMWLERGIPIKYLQFRLPQQGTLEEPDIEIPVDGYRSYNHEVVSTKKTSK
ncbi:MAG: tRNA (guanosine(46)-N7)-methyltransferase TrmB [Bacteroidaceae bacterium]|nr:tRNA (guanosine(46)-N7)-methyltransferase TrmB [Bacteroidaceae bacterium]